MTETPRTPRRHETRALLRAHLAAATRFHHVTRHCPVCHRLLRLAMESPEPSPAEHSAGSSAGTGPAARQERKPPAT